MRAQLFLKTVRNKGLQISLGLSIATVALSLPQPLMAQGVDLGTAQDFVVLAGAGITNTGSTTLFGNVGTHPTPSITGFNTVTLDGVIHGDNAVSQQAKLDLLTAYNDAAGRPAPPANTYAPIFDLGGLTLIPGVYNDPTSFEITGVLTLDGQGSPDSVWIFQTGSTLLTASNSSISLINGADACNIFWQVGSSATLGTGTDFAGTIMALTSITLNTGATVDGRALALNGAVTMDGNTVLRSICDLVVDGTTTITLPISIDTISMDDDSALLLSSSLIVTDGGFHVASGQATISGGTVIVPGDFTKTGVGALDADTLLKVGGIANVSQGTLLVSAELQADRVIVLPEAGLGGGGLIIGNVFNSGLVAPGDLPKSSLGSSSQIGTLSLLGDYTQTSNGALQIEIAGPNQKDRLIVSETARLAGTLDVRTVGGQRLEYGDRYPILEAGSINGAFGRILMPEPELRGRFLNNGRSGILLVAPISYTLVARTPNESRIGQALDTWIGRERGDIGAATLSLDLLKAEEYPAAFEAIAPGFHGGAMNTTIELSHNQGQLLFQQLSSRRLGRMRSDRNGGADDDSGARITDDGSGKRVVDDSQSHSGGSFGGKEVRLETAPAPWEIDPDGWNLWVLGSGLYSEGGMGLTPGDDFESGTFMVGADRAVTEFLALGLFTSYQDGRGDYDNGGSTDLESVRVGAYAALDFEGFYASGAAGVGTTDYHTKRPIQWATLDRTAWSDTDGSEYFAMLGTGYDFHAGNFTFGPAVSAQYTHLKMDGFTERGADSLNLRVRDFNGESLRSYLGGRIAYTHRVNPDFTVIPELRAFWQHEHLDEGTGIPAELNGGNGPGFNYFTEGGDDNAVYAGAGVSMRIGDSLTLSTFYHADFGSEEDTQNSVSISASWGF